MTAFQQAKDVVRYRIDLPKSYKRMEWAFERYNGQFAKPRVKMPHIFLARELIRLYAMAFQRWQAARGYAVNLDWNEMPLLAVNNQFLGDITGRTDRSIRNYRKTLENAGFLAVLGHDEEGNAEFSVHHGRTCDFELAISPEFLWIESNRTGECLRIANAPTTCMRKNFPPTSTSTSTGTEQEQLELVGGKICSEAEKISEANAELPESSASCQLEQPEQPEPASGNIPEQPEPINRNEQRRQRPAGEPEQPEQRARPAGGAPSEDRAELAHKNAKILFNYAKAWLYPGEVIPQGRRQAILAKLACLYGDAPPEHFLKITRIYVHRLKLAQLYWHRHYGALPPPEEFFDASNSTNGFVLTKKWPNDPEAFPPPPRVTYKLPNENRRGAGRRGVHGHIGNFIN